MKGFFVTATDTEVGKTVIAGAIAGVLRKQGKNAGVYKPVQSGHVAGHLEGDAARLKALSGVDDPLDHICPFSAEEPLAPILALRRAGKHVTLGHLKHHYTRLKEKYEYMIVEGAGGLAVPYVEDGLVVDAALMFKLPLLIVARPNLGTVNHTLLTIEFAKQRGLQVAGVVLSGYQEETAGIAEQTNPDIIHSYSGVPVIGVIPWITESNQSEYVLSAVEQCIDWNQLRIL
ncbi:dethiobiotin synthase [Neobacillus sp. DY30]|uniref:dethiobiotin synthase n=1 Tax=Neobacillus sp. DY30 TaxID=3047871 RepID=UPI0024C017B7|nr:dethiobiotin synthase [Neobacillus sp. DY30]WHY00911.1 dethiobiotin synthase [Neobacillus sp. DY30]